MEVVWTFVVTIACTASGEERVDQFTVINGTGKPLLGRSTAEKLKMLRVGPVSGPQVCSVVTEGSDKGILIGLGKLTGYQLKLHIYKDVRPAAQQVRRIPFGLRDKVDQKLDGLLDKDIIEEVTNAPTTWLSPLVVAHKPNSDIRICVDMGRANEAIIRERHPIPTIDEILYDLNGSIVFSKLDLRWAIDRIELDKESRDITMFVTHRGLYRYERLMFGISSAPVSIRRSYKMLYNPTMELQISPMICLSTGQIWKSMIRISMQFYGVCVRFELTLNGEKCQFTLPMLTFLGHDLNSEGVTPSEETIAAVVSARVPKNV